MKLTILPTGLLFDRSGLHAGSVDIAFDGRVVWSFEVAPSVTPWPVRDPEASDAGAPDAAAAAAPAEAPAEALEPEAWLVEWPEPLRAYLTGSTRLRVTESGGGRVLAEVEHAFDDGEGRVSIVGATGRNLTVNKWGRLGVQIGDLAAGAQDRILDRTERLISELRAMDLRPFIVGGTLLGAVRDGCLLPHDDDADIAYLSHHDLPIDVALESLGVGRRLEALGYEVDRHSAAHTQILFRDADGELDHYIDVFAAFFTDDGCINQPFHVRGELRPDQMLPFGEVEIAGRRLPAPADTDAWLTLNYDAEWRTPKPGFRLDTPQATRDRFDAWFGGFHFQWEFWNDWYLSGAQDAAIEPGRRWILDEADRLSAPVLLDVGCGTGETTFGLAGEGRRVVGVDYAAEGLRIARRRMPGATDGGPAVSFVRRNLYEREVLAVIAETAAGGACDIVLNHVMEQIGHLGRENAWRLIRMAVASGGGARFTVHTLPNRDDEPGDPPDWHVTREQLTAEAADFDLRLEFIDLDTEPDRSPRRAPVGVRVASVDKGEPQPC